MNARQSQLTGRLRLRHLLEVTEAKGEEMEEAAPRFHRLAREDAAPRVVSSFCLFQTPEPIAARVAGMFQDFGRTLEPSAGLGRLYNALRARCASCPVVLVEQSAECCGELYLATEGDALASLTQGDFLEQTPERLGLFQSILMNPPFKMGIDVKHVKHALTFLAPGGRLVSICANGPKQRKHLEPLASEWIVLPSGSFRSEGTGVETAIVVIDR
jgi:hypothetical protein